MKNVLKCVWCRYSFGRDVTLQDISNRLVILPPKSFPKQTKHVIYAILLKECQRLQ